MDLQTAASVALLFVVVVLVTPFAWRLVAMVLHAQVMDRIDRAKAMAQLQATIAEVQKTAERLKAVAPALARPPMLDPARPHLDRDGFPYARRRTDSARTPLWEPDQLDARRADLPPRQPRLEFYMVARDGRPVHLENGG